MDTFAYLCHNQGGQYMQFYTQEQMVDKHVGVKGTPAREEYDEQVELMLVGEAILKARIAQSLEIPFIGRVALC